MTHFRSVPALAWLMALAAPMSHAANAYYVDANAPANGNGSLAAPFRTIDQVNKAQYPTQGTTPATIVEGDAVYFKCGASWPGKAEPPTTLLLKTGVKYNSYYNSSSFPIYGCASTTTAALARPVLRGSVKLSGLSWKQDSGNSHIFWADITSTVGTYGRIGQLIDPTLSAVARRLQRARHPNIGSGNYAGAPGSRYLHVGSATEEAANGAGPFNMQLDTTAPMPSTCTDLTGAKAFVRSHDWLLSKFNVTQHTGDTIKIAFDDPGHQYLDSIRRTGEEVGGYWLENQKCMLDSAGEWFEEKIGSTRKLYVWRADGTAPPSSTTYYASVNDFGITAGLNGNVVDIDKIANNFSLKNIEVQDTVLDGVAIMGNPLDTNTWALNAFTMDGISVIRAGRFGIVVRSANGISGSAANNINIKNAFVQGSMDAGIDLTGAIEAATNALSPVSGQAWMGPSRGVDVVNNTLTDIGMDQFALSAIKVGGNSTVMGNTITNTVSRAIDVEAAHTVVRSNHINNACLRIDDCGAIYTHGSWAPNSIMDLVVRSNVIESVGGAASIDGRRPNNPMGNMGIYLDDNASNVTLDGNSITAADLGIFLHGSRNSTVSNNAVDLSRRAALEFGPSSGAIADWQSAHNQIINNAFLSRAGFDIPAVTMHTGTSPLPNPAAFATFSGNVYGARTAKPFWDITNNDSYVKTNFAQWQAQGRDTNGRIYLDVPAYVPTSATAPNLISNGGFETNAALWASDTPGTLTVSSLLNNTNCYKSGSCIRLDRLDNSYDWITFHTQDQAFSTSVGKTYLLVFDARSASMADSVMVRLNRAGSAGELSTWNKVAIGTQWTRYAIPLLATAAATDGRVDIITVNKSSIYLDNVRLIETTRQTNDETMSFYMVYNKTKTTQSVACGASLTGDCGAYKDLQTGSSVAFPFALDPWTHKAVYWDAVKWTDQDGDGVPDWVDLQCPNTPANAGANETGCGIGQ